MGSGSSSVVSAIVAQSPDNVKQFISSFVKEFSGHVRLLSSEMYDVNVFNVILLRKNRILTYNFWTGQDVFIGSISMWNTKIQFFTFCVHVFKGYKFLIINLPKQIHKSITEYIENEPLPIKKIDLLKKIVFYYHNQDIYENFLTKKLETNQTKSTKPTKFPKKQKSNIKINSKSKPSKKMEKIQIPRMIINAPLTITESETYSSNQKIQKISIGLTSPHQNQSKPSTDKSSNTSSSQRNNKMTDNPPRLGSVLESNFHMDETNPPVNYNYHPLEEVEEEEDEKDFEPGNTKQNYEVVSSNKENVNELNVRPNERSINVISPSYSKKHHNNQMPYSYEITSSATFSEHENTVKNFQINQLKSRNPPLRFKRIENNGRHHVHNHHKNQKLKQNDSYDDNDDQNGYYRPQTSHHKNSSPHQQKQNRVSSHHHRSSSNNPHHHNYDTNETNNRNNVTHYRSASSGRRKVRVKKYLISKAPTSSHTRSQSQPRTSVKRIKYSKDANEFASNVAFFSSDEEDRKANQNSLERNIDDDYNKYNVNNNNIQKVNFLNENNESADDSLSFFSIENHEPRKYIQNDDNEINVQNVFPEIPSYDFNQQKDKTNTNNNNYENCFNRNIINNMSSDKSNSQRSSPNELSNIDYMNPNVKEKKIQCSIQDIPNLSSTIQNKKDKEKPVQRNLNLNNNDLSSSSSTYSYIKSKNQALYQPRNSNQNSNPKSQKLASASVSDIDITDTASGQYARLVFCDNSMSPEIQELHPSRRRSVGKTNKRKRNNNELGSFPNKRTEEEKNKIWDSIGQSKFTKQKNQLNKSNDAIDLNSSASSTLSKNDSNHANSINRKSRDRQNSNNDKKVITESLNDDFSQKKKSHRPRAESVHSHHAYNQNDNEIKNFVQKKKIRKSNSNLNSDSLSEKENKNNKRKLVSTNDNADNKSSSKRSISVSTTKKQYERKSEDSSKKNINHNIIDE